MKSSHLGSLCLGLVLLVSMAGCGTPREAGEAAKTAQPKAPDISAGSQQLLALLPEDNALPGWTRSGDVRFFGPGNLWEYINGAAEGYLSYNFQEVVTAEYSNPEKQSQSVIDVYRMEDPLNAFGIYTQELNPDSEFHKIGVEGYVGGTALNFWS
jgi:hypothetical protein